MSQCITKHISDPRLRSQHPLSATFLPKAVIGEGRYSLPQLLRIELQDTTSFSLSEYARTRDFCEEGKP